MFKLSQYLYLASFLALGLAMLFYLWHALAHRRLTILRAVTTTGSRLPFVAAIASGQPGAGVGRNATIMAANGLVFLTLCLTFRAIATGHGPFANMFEYSVAFAWGIMAAYLYFEARYRTRALGVIVLPIALGLLWYASTIPAEIQPLVPALQNSLLLTTHVAVAIIAYGTFAVSFAAALLGLSQLYAPRDWLPSTALLDEIGYRMVVIGFPMMSLVIILGALWADVAWGQYWSWDPKETASLVTWLIYGGYLHARVMRGWRGARSALLLIAGFAAVLLTYFGNLFFGGLHSYAGLG